MNVGKAIKELRTSKKLTQTDLATSAGITQASLSAIENGNRPSEETLNRLANKLGVSVALIYVMAIEDVDVPKSKRLLYEKIFPIIKGLVKDLAV